MDNNDKINKWGFIGKHNQDNNASSASVIEIQECETWLKLFTRKGSRTVGAYGIKPMIQKWLNVNNVDIGSQNYIHTGALLEAARNLDYNIGTRNSDNTAVRSTGFIYCNVSKRAYRLM